MSDDPPPPEIDIEALLARMAPPQVPSDAIALNPALADLIEGLAPGPTVAALAGLQTEPQFQANLVRTEWAIRLVLALARGTRQPSRSDLHQLLNTALSKARVNLLEDPIEDFFVEPVPTTEGDFLLLSGTWEQAAFYTETLISAFKRLPDAEPKRDALHWASTLLRLSDVLVRRAQLERRAIGGGDPKGRIKLPSSARLKTLAARVMFSWEELEQIGLIPPDFYPFTLPMKLAESLLGGLPGNTVLDFRPLICVPEGILVASPTNLTTAARALLIDTAVQGGMAEALQRRLLDTQAEAIWDSTFAKLEGFPVRRVGRYLARCYGREVSSGRFVNYIQVMDNFDGWPDSAFGDVTDQPEVSELICGATRAAQAAFEKQGPFTEGLTVCFLGGWGRGRTLALLEDDTLTKWEFLLLSSGDASAIARCEGGTVRDLWRLQKQRTLVEQQGFQLVEVNGLLNLFHWWRLTDHALVPPGWTDAVPPAMITMGTDHLLEARREGLEALDRRALAHADGTHRIVTRLDPEGYLGGLMPIYGSLADVRRGELVGAVLSEPLIFWLHLDSPRDDPRSYDTYETWKAAFHWLQLTLAPFWQRFVGGATAKPVAATLSIEWPEALQDRPLADDAIAATVEISQEVETQRPRLTLKPDWQRALRRPDNVAEVELATALLNIASKELGIDIEKIELRAFVVEVAGSPDVRWRHTFMASHAIDVLKYHGLLARLRPVPMSAGALLKCGMAFLTHDRADGPKIQGKAACREFLYRQLKALTDQLRERVGIFDKQSFIVQALTAHQAAQGELRSWEFTARANRAIHGTEEDYRGSLERVNEANGVVRSAAMLTEVASAEAKSEVGQELGDMDFAELQALALLIIQLGDVVPALMGDWIEPEIVISPTGDVLTDHRFTEQTLQKSAERRHEVERERHSDDYDALFAKPKEPKGLPAEFRDAIAAEYLADSEVVLDLPFAAARLAANRKAGVFVVPRDELISAIEAFDAMKGQRVAPLIDRLTMPARTSLDDLPPGYAASDFDLTRFDRRPSLIARPIIPLSPGPNPKLVVAPAVIERALYHNLGGALTGALQNAFWSTEQMRFFSSVSGTKIGLEFNETVAEQIRALGLRAWPSAKPAWALNCKATPEIEKLGDIDVLAVTEDGTRVWVIEAKDLKLCRTMGEIARRLSDYRGRLDEKGRPDKMLRHLLRVTYLREHAAELVGRLGLPGTPEISGALIVRSPQPMEHVQVVTSPDARVVMSDDLDTIPWRRGWSITTQATSA